jgi:C1A family cysteine protease
MNAPRRMPVCTALHVGLCTLFICTFITGALGGPASTGEQAPKAVTVPAEVPRFAPPPDRQLEAPPPGMGFMPPPVDFSHIRPRIAPMPLSLPSHFDWRETGKVTPVKHQGSCGSCYAFGSIANFESRVLIGEDTAFDFSENNVKECEWHAPSCGGGNFWMVANRLSTAGTVLEVCDPYVASDVRCAAGCEFQKTLLDWRVISGSSIPSVDVLKSYIQTYGPVYTTMYGGSGNAWYSEFVSYDGSYTLYHEDTHIPNHAVLIVGWDDDLEHDGGEGAWIVKNSWGASWGGPCGYGSEGGYFTIAYGSAQIGAYSSFVYDWQDYDPEGGLLYHDEAGFTGSLGYVNPTGWGLCKFVPTEDCAIERVEFWTVDATIDLDIYIYDDFNGGIVSNLLASELDTPFENAGYHSVALSSAAPISEGDAIYVTVKFANAQSLFPIPYDTSGPKASGCSFISASGGYFTEFPNGDIGIRVRTTDKITCGGMSEAPVITAVTDVPGDNGGYVDVSWQRSTLDDEEASPRIKHYKVWRRRREDPLALLGSGGDDPEYRGPYEQGQTGPAWEVIGTVSATGQCCYQFSAPTECDMSPADTCWTYFCVTAHTGAMGDHYDSDVTRGYSIDNQGMASEPESEEGQDERGVEETRDDGVVLAPPEPNPGRGGFAIKFELGRNEWTNLTVYDVTGRRIAVLHDGLTDPGPRMVRWDPGANGTAKPSPGLYFVRLETESEIHTVKLILIRYYSSARSWAGQAPGLTMIVRAGTWPLSYYYSFIIFSIAAD